MSLTLILQTVTPVFFIILIGFIIGKYKKINIQPLVNFIVYISGPCLIFSSISKSNIDLKDFFTIASSATAVILIIAFLVFIILKITNSKKVSLYLPITIGNTGYLGYPVALFAFGAAGLSGAIVYDMINSLFLFSLGICIVHHKNDIKEAFKLPLIYAVIVGLLFNLLKIPVPEIISKPLEMIGAITIPSALMILGYKLTEIRISSARIAFIAFLASIFRIFGGFLAGLVIIRLFSIEGTAKNIILLQSAMPSAVMSMILCQKYSRDAELVASVVFISTLISVVSIPLILSFLY